jgi:hypothetical protein
MVNQRYDTVQLQPEHYVPCWVLAVKENWSCQFPDTYKWEIKCEDFSVVILVKHKNINFLMLPKGILWSKLMDRWTTEVVAIKR